MHILERFTEGPEECPYLRDRMATHEYEIHAELLPDEYEDFMNTGWRKFGLMLFHPICGSCQECRAIRVLVGCFQPSRSQSRAALKSDGLRVKIQRPQVDAERLSLLQKYHSVQEHRRGWKPQSSSEESYYYSFVLNRLPAYEITLWAGERLVSVILLEETPKTLSAVYHYHELRDNRRGYGTLAILHAILLARQMEKPFLYLGYLVKGCLSSMYKAKFRPYEILGEDGIWRSPEETVGSAGVVLGG
jgi:arginine-tRNA-protein transferase